MDSSDQVETTSEFNDSWDFSNPARKMARDSQTRSAASDRLGLGSLSHVKAPAQDHKRLRSSAEEQRVRSQVAR